MGQMCWMSKYDGDEEKILHLRMEANQPWTPYTRMPHIAVPDYKVPRGSKGWATYQKLLKAGWTLLPCPGVLEEDRNIDPVKNVRVWAQANILPENIGFLYADLMEVIAGIRSDSYDADLKSDCICLGYAIYNRSDIDTPTLNHLHESLSALVRRTTVSLEAAKV